MASHSPLARDAGARLRDPPGSWILVLLPIAAFIAIALRTEHLMIGCIGVALSAMLAWWLAGGREGGASRLGLERPTSWLRTGGEAVAVAIAAAVVLSLVSGPITTRFGTPDLRYFASMGQHPMELAEWLAITWTTAALGEEIVFRGYLVPQLAPVRTLGRAGWVIGIGVSSALFGLAHSYQGAGGAIASGIVGAVFAIAFALDRRNLWRTIIAHGLFDTASLLLLFVALRHPPSQ